MFNDQRDLYVSYPFMPVDSMPDWFGHVKYMRVAVTLPAMQPMALGKNGDFIKATLTTLYAMQAVVHVECAAYGVIQNGSVVPWETDITIPIVIGGIPVGNSYMYADRALPLLNNLNYRIHPECLLFQQMAPALRITGSTSGQPPEVTLEYASGSVSQWIAEDALEDYLIDSVLWLENGHNVEVAKTQDAIVFTGSPGAGKGTWAEAPVTGGTTYDGFAGEALKSINGHTGNVLLQGDKSVDVRITGNTILISEPAPTIGAQE